MAYLLFCVELVAVIVVISIAGKIFRGRGRKQPACVVPLSCPQFPSIDKARSAALPRRQATRITVEECEDLVFAQDNLVFIALRDGGADPCPPFPKARAVCIAPSELFDVLMLIPDCAVVLCAENVQYPSILEALKDIDRVMPIYFLASSALRAEAAEAS